MFLSSTKLQIFTNRSQQIFGINLKIGEVCRL